MAIAAMKAGKHAFVEVPLALTLKELWDIVETSERTGKHCMMMENCNYGREELMFLNMCRLGVFGELLHGEAAYIHELRGQMHDVERGRGTGSWRRKSRNMRRSSSLEVVAPIPSLCHSTGVSPRSIRQRNRPKFASRDCA